jgi:hypothetical protein
MGTLRDLRYLDPYHQRHGSESKVKAPIAYSLQPIAYKHGL